MLEQQFTNALLNNDSNKVSTVLASEDQRTAHYNTDAAALAAAFGITSAGQTEAYLQARAAIVAGYVSNLTSIEQKLGAAQASNDTTGIANFTRMLAQATSQYRVGLAGLAATYGVSDLTVGEKFGLAEDAIVASLGSSFKAWLQQPASVDMDEIDQALGQFSNDLAGLAAAFGVIAPTEEYALAKGQLDAGFNSEIDPLVQQLLTVAPGSDEAASLQQAVTQLTAQYQQLISGMQQYFGIG